jgi:hypothetical protein
MSYSYNSQTGNKQYTVLSVLATSGYWLTYRSCIGFTGTNLQFNFEKGVQSKGKKKDVLRVKNMWLCGNGVSGICLFLLPPLPPLFLLHQAEKRARISLNQVLNADSAAICILTHFPIVYLAKLCTKLRKSLINLGK